MPFTITVYSIDHVRLTHACVTVKSRLLQLIQSAITFSTLQVTRRFNNMLITGDIGILHMQNWSSGAELTKRHKNFKSSQIFWAAVLLTVQH